MGEPRSGLGGDVDLGPRRPVRLEAAGHEVGVQVRLEDGNDPPPPGRRFLQVPPDGSVRIHQDRQPIARIEQVRAVAQALVDEGGDIHTQ